MWCARVCQEGEMEGIDETTPTHPNDLIQNPQWLVDGG